MHVPPRPTLHDVAACAGVSIATVSRVLNGTGIIRPETEARVREAVRQLGFRPNRMAGICARGTAAASACCCPRWPTRYLPTAWPASRRPRATRADGADHLQRL